MQEKNSLIFKIIFFLVVIAVVFAIYFGFKNNNQETKKIENESEEQEEIKKIKEANKKIIKESQMLKDETVRPVDESDHILGDISSAVQVIVYNDFD